jgi:hypothetical protein
MGDGLAIEIKIGDRAIRGWLPLFPTRFALEGAYRRALGWMPKDAEKPSGESSEQDFAAVLCAYVGACWGGDPLELTRHTSTGPEIVTCPPSPAALRAFDRDLVEFGEAVLDSLARRGYDAGDVFKAGEQIRRAVIASIPLQSEVETEADFSEARAADSTAAMSSSG